MHCPICRYNLRGLAPAALCPECGSTPEQRTVALVKRPRFLIPSIFAASTTISVAMIFLMGSFFPHPLEVLFLFAINSLPHFFAWSVLATFARPKTRTEAALAALPPAVTIIAALGLIHCGLFFPRNYFTILLSPAFAILPALIACLLSFLLLSVKRTRTATQKPGRH